MSVEVINLTKTYGQQKAVDNASFKIDRGEVLGFLGPNGAGKSTTMKIATGFIPPNQGTVIIEGLDIQEKTKDVKKLVGYLPENNPLYLDMFVSEYLEFVGKLHGISKNDLKNRVFELIEMVGLQRERHKKIEELSKGYRQRIGLAQALIHDPEVLFLDEPTSGLDPNQIVEIRKLISDLGKEKTVVLSSHIMQEVEAICNRAVIINQGKIVADDKVENLKSKLNSQLMFRIEFATKIEPKILEQLDSVNEIDQINEKVFELKSNKDQDPRSDIFEISKEQNWTILEIRTLDTNLENIFQQLTRK